MDRRTVAAAVAALAALVAIRLLARGIELSWSWGGEPPDSTAGAWSFGGGLATLVAGLIAAPRIAGASHPWLRALAALPAAAATGVALDALHVPSLGPWGERVTLLAALVVGQCVLVAGCARMGAWRSSTGPPSPPPTPS